MALTSATTYSAMVEAVEAQRVRLFGPQPRDRWTSEVARQFRADPRRSLSSNLAAVAEYVRPEDVVLDVGGGAGRISLPLALRSREVVCVEPSDGMRREFQEAAREASITNARVVPTDWLSASDVSGDVAIVADVTYFVRDIEPFIRKLDRSARRRVIITIWSVPPPNHQTSLFRLVLDEEQKPAPGHRELLPVIWDLGILPELRVLPDDWTHVWPSPIVATREEAVELAFSALARGHDYAKADHVKSAIQSHFSRLFEEIGRGYRPCWGPSGVRELLITWEPRG